VTGVVALSAVVSFRSVYEPDLGWHLAHGRENLSGRLVRTNVFSSTAPDYRQRYTSWLSETAAYIAWRAGGDVGLQTLQASAIAGALTLTYLACRLSAGALPSLSLLILGFLVLEPRAIPRPHLASFVGLAAVGWLVQRRIASRSVKPMWWCVPVVALWSNLHSEVVFGVALVAIFAAGELVRPSALDRRQSARALAAAMACAVALLVNPYGWGLLLYLYENASVPQLLGIAELQPPYLPVYRGFFAYSAIALALLVSFPRRLTVWEVAAVGVFAAIGFRYLRLTPLVFFVTAPMVASRLAMMTTRGVDGRAMLVTVCAAAVLITRVPVTTMIAGMRLGGSFPEVVFPTPALSFIKAHGLNGPVFNSHNLGGWLEWTEYPDVRVFQDSRLQAYPPDHFRAILDASRSQPQWDALTSGVDWAILSLARPNALSGVGRFPAATWATVYEDEAVEIVVRRNGRYGSLAAAR
jgi:hypothetical protein